MAKKTFNQVLLEKGEKIGLGAAIVVTFLLIVTHLFWGKHGLFAESPRTLEKKLAADVQRTTARMSDPENKPEPGSDALPKGYMVKDGTPGKSASAELEAFALQKIDNPSEYSVGNLFAVANPADTNRRQPAVLSIAEARAVPAYTQLCSFILNDKRTQIGMVEGTAGTGGTGTPMPMGPGPDSLSKLKNFYNGNKGSLGPAPSAPGAGGGNYSMPDSNGLVDEPIKPLQMMPIEKLPSLTNMRPAETIRPLRMVVLAASFPYKAQLDEFRTKLRLPSRSAVLAEPALEKSAEGQYLPAFRFLKVELQRREVTPEGKEIGGKNWEDLDVVKNYTDFVILSGRRTEPEDPLLDAISFDRLVMQRLLQVRPDQYPPVEKTLPTLAASLEALADKKVTSAPPSILSPDGFDPFSKATGTGGEFGRLGGPGMPMPGGAAPGMSLPGPGPGQPGPRFPGPGTGTGTGTGMGPGYLLPEVQPPEHCLIRLVDVKNIQPGKAYKYRLRVRMANPNYGRTDVANPKYATETELEPQPWFELPDPVLVPPEMHYYAVDQKELDGKDYKDKGINYVDGKPAANQVAIQIHRWLERVPNPSGRFQPVGEWVVAERLFVGRGEYVGRQQTIEMPVWIPEKGRFIIPKKKEGSKDTSGWPVSFGLSPTDTVVVDFTGGEVKYEATEGRGERPVKTTIKDTQRTEVLLWSPDGKLLALDGAADAQDKVRTDRVADFRKRVEAVKKNLDTNPMGGGTNPNPFGGP